MRIQVVLFALLCAMVATAGCDSSASTPASTASGDAGATDGTAAPALTSLAKAASADVEVELLAAKPLAVGWQQVYYRVKVAGQPLTAATLVQKPLMAMMGKQHACPAVQPAQQADAQGLFVGQLLPQMASNASESWTLDVDVTPAGGSQTTVALGKIPVAEAPYAKTLLVGSGMAAERYTVIVHFPAAPKVGLNPYRVALHKVSSDMMSFDPVPAAVFKGTPEMVSMGHGSSGNVDPVAVGGGFYEGKLSVSMPGDWRLTLAITVDGKALGSVVFDWMI